MANKRTPGKPPSQSGNRARMAPGKSRDPNDLRYVALHEAGHAVAAVVLGLSLKKVFIKQCPTTGVRVGFTDSGGLTDNHLPSVFEKEMEARLIQCYAGFRAEIKENPAASKTFRFALDEEDAYRVFVLEFCESTDPDVGTIEDVLAYFRRHGFPTAHVVASFRREARELLAKHWQAVLEVADLLVQKKALSGKEVAAIVNAARAVSSSNPLPQPAPHSAIPPPTPPG
jgi:cell division protease FtsH